MSYLNCQPLTHPLATHIHLPWSPPTLPHQLLTDGSLSYSSTSSSGKYTRANPQRFLPRVLLRAKNQVGVCFACVAGKHIFFTETQKSHFRYNIHSMFFPDLFFQITIIELKCTQTLLVALLDGLLDESLDLFESLEEAVLELPGLFSTHPEDP